ncbi:hypothetical protein GEMRC1_012858 [Eukaryota sp. GEM-RC1]
MLSAETASGQFPVEAVTIMDSIMLEAEAFVIDRSANRTGITISATNDVDAVAFSAKEMARQVGAKCMINFTETGFSTCRLSRTRPGIPIVAVSPSIDVLRKLNIVYGVRGVHCGGVSNFDELPDAASEYALNSGFAKRGDKIVVVAGTPFNTPYKKAHTACFNLIVTV